MFRLGNSFRALGQFVPRPMSGVWIIVLLLSVTVCGARVATAQSATWAFRKVGTSPPPRSEYAMSESPDGNVLIFGGLGGPNGNTYLNDTWLWDGSTWHNLTSQKPTNNPPARSSASMAYDRAHGQVVLYGGQTQDSPGGTDDTWVFNGSFWKQAASPAFTVDLEPLYGTVMAYDEKVQRIVVFGGVRTGGLLPFHGFPGELFVWDGSKWDYVRRAEIINQVPESPGGSYAHDFSHLIPGRAATLVYYPPGGYLVLTGGAFPPPLVPLELPDPQYFFTWGVDVFFNGNRTLSFDIYVKNLEEDYSLPIDSGATGFWPGGFWPGGARSDAAMSYYPVSGKIIRFGGICDFNSNWYYSFSNAKNPCTGNQLFGTPLDDTKSWPGHALPLPGPGILGSPIYSQEELLSWDWQLVSSHPSARSGARMAYHANTGQLVLFGGVNGANQNLNDTWTWGKQVACLPGDGSTVHVGSTVRCFFAPQTDDVQFSQWTTDGFAPNSSTTLNKTFHTNGPGPASITAAWFDSTGQHTETFNFTIEHPHQ